MQQEPFDRDNEPQKTQHGILNNIAPGEIIIGLLVGLNDQGQPLVSYQENTSDNPTVALTTVALSKQQIGRQIAILFAEGNPEKPVIMGLIHSVLDELLENFELKTESQVSTEPQHAPSSPAQTIDDVRLDGKRVVLEGKQEIVLKCGDASITLTKAGKIIIRGKYLLSRSSGVNRIQGGSVKVN